jgi:hypothetical protein
MYSFADFLDWLRDVAGDPANPYTTSTLGRQRKPLQVSYDHEGITVYGRPSIRKPIPDTRTWKVFIHYMYCVEVARSGGDNDSIQFFDNKWCLCGCSITGLALRA